MRVLVAGVTGQLGHGLVEVGDRHGVEIVPLVRRISRRDAADRVGRAFPGDERLAGEALTGDVTQPLWGIEPRSLDRLAGTIDVVLDLAAETNWAATSRRLTQTNTLGAAHGLGVAAALARPGSVPAYCYASSIHAAGGLEGQIGEQPFTPRGDRTPYEQSKWLAEGLLLDDALRADAPPVAIARIGGLVGNSTSGATVRRNSLYMLAEPDRLIRGLLPVAPRGRVDMLARDTAADLLARYLLAVADDPPATPELVHVCAGEDAPTTVSLLAAARSVDRAGVARQPRPVPMPPRALIWASEQLDRFQSLSTARRNVVVGLRYLTFDRVFERARLRARVGDLPAGTPVERLAALAFGIEQPVSPPRTLGRPLARFAG